jgi:hypothetical protein
VDETSNNELKRMRKMINKVQLQWLMPVIPTIQVVEIGKIVVQG